MTTTLPIIRQKLEVVWADILELDEVDRDEELAEKYLHDLVYKVIHDRD